MDPLKEIEGLVSNKLDVIKTLFSLFKLEARLAGLSIFPLLLTIILLLAITLTTSITVMLLLGYCAFYFLQSYLLAVVCVLLFNFIAAFYLIKTLTFNLKSMSFEKTRKHLSSKEN